MFRLRIAHWLDRSPIYDHLASLNLHSVTALARSGPREASHQSAALGLVYLASAAHFIQRCQLRAGSPLTRAPKHAIAVEALSFSAAVLTLYPAGNPLRDTTVSAKAAAHCMGHLAKFAGVDPTADFFDRYTFYAGLIFSATDPVVAFGEALLKLCRVRADCAVSRVARGIRAAATEYFDALVSEYGQLTRKIVGRQLYAVDDHNSSETEEDGREAEMQRRLLARRKWQASQFRAAQGKLADLLAYCTADGRVCPKPREWDRLWQSLPDRRRDGSGWHPPAPLILAAWHATSDDDKRSRLAEHLRWAAARGAIDAVAVTLTSLPATGWHYSPEGAGFR